MFDKEEQLSLPGLTMRHCFDLHRFRDLLIAGPPSTPPAHLRLEQCIYQRRLSEAAVTWDKGMEEMP